MADRLASLQNLVDLTASHSKERRTVRISKNTASSWRTVWDDAMREFYPECRITYGRNEAANLKRMIATRGLPAEDLKDFFYWIVSKWEDHRRNVFSANPAKPYGPAQPDMKFVIVNVAKMHAAFMRSKPEVAATIPLAKRRTQAAPAPATAAAPAKRYTTTATKAEPARVIRLPIKPVLPSADREALRQKLNLPQWKD